MPYGLYLSAEGAHAQVQRMEVISNNLANVDSPGFKQQLAVLQARHAEAIKQGEDVSGSESINDIGGGVLTKQTLTNFSRGILKQTGIPTDMAIDGDGFFEVMRNGEKFLTRAGNFNRDNNGFLQTPDGFDVLSSDGEPIQILDTEPWHLTPDGYVVQEASGTIPLSLVKPQQPGDLVRVGQNLFSSLAKVMPVFADDRQVRGGYLEQSDVQPTTEMMSMIETSRAFEANVRLIQMQDNAMDSLINRVLGQS